ncbi:hypothetical protein BD289DRAFT_443404 [Coniella lustricola]|uniref:Uncharacterized protein n=1 Tax=Coniella lustricola TaxID=2025994 RepID=A0A2T2ZX18_9PEZI|nr:hypothetical protein BD289DRAFT_443404 [Coniella lustricola]
MASIDVGVEAFNAFLQANVTGPVLSHEQTQLARPHEGQVDLTLSSLDVDGVSPYPFIPHIDLFCLAKHAIDNATTESWAASSSASVSGISLPWMRLRLHVWHYKLFIQPSLSAGSIFTKNIGLSEVPSLVEKIQDSLREVESDVLGEAWEVTSSSSSERWPAQDKVRFLVEKANVCIMLGQDIQARNAMDAAAELNGFVYALSGALGKRTRFQEKSTSQLVVLAKSGVAATTATDQEPHEVPEALPLNDDTLLEQIEYTQGDGLHGELNSDPAAPQVPAALQDLKPDAQPQLSPLDQIILLTQATLKDSFSPVDTLTSEEIMPFAVRVISDKSTNWQIYTQALLVRSRIEMHRSRTVERGVLQMQAVVDQVLVDTTQKLATHDAEDNDAPAKPEGHSSVPSISVSVPQAEAPAAPKHDREEAAPVENKPYSFFPAAKSEDSAPAPVRLEFIHALSSPPRWHLESELAYAWTGVGSLVSALEIFKRLKLWAEVALCLASSASTDNEDGSNRGGGGEDKARAIIRWRLFHRKPEATANGAPVHDQDDNELDEETDITTLRADTFTGPERSPPQPNAPRLFCILGDIETDSAVAHYETAWRISKQRYARAQKSLGEHYLAQKDWVKAREAYQLAVSVNRLSPEMWSRLGDINLRLGDFAAAAEAFTRAIGSSNDSAGGEDARTWSNLGSALYSMYQEAIEKERKGHDEQQESTPPTVDEDEDDDMGATKPTLTTIAKNPSNLLAQSLNAYKRGASIAHSNWRIWDNVITLATRMRPMPFFDIIQAVRAIIRARNTEDAIDIDILHLLLKQGVFPTTQNKTITTSGPYDPPRGSVERNVNDMMENEIVPLITVRSELWEVLSQLRAWRRDWSGAVDASEKAWRAAVGGATSGAGSLGGGLAAADASAAKKKREGGEAEVVNRNWLEDKEAWQVVVQRTVELVAALKSYGPQVEDIGDKWRGKARMAIRSVMGKGKESWEGTEGWETLQGLIEEVRA